MEAKASFETQKALLRKELLEKLNRLEPGERSQRSQKILQQLFDHPKFSEARSILTYVALASEVETKPIIEEARKKWKTVYVPRLDRVKKRIWIIDVRSIEELTTGLYGILEPPFDPRRVGKPEDLDLVVVPGVGFDGEGGRLGRGEGYFDRFLAEAKKAYKIGLAFEFQVIEKVPRSSHDVLLDEILSG